MKKIYKTKSKLIFALQIILCFIVSNKLLGQENKKLRDLSPDRPHQTESPITVDKWHVMIEADLANYNYKKTSDDALSTYGIGLPNIKFGFHKRMDLEIISNVYTHEIYKKKSLPDATKYFQDLTFRYKINVCGNDSGKFAMAIMPTLKTTNFFKENMQLLSGGIFVNIEQELPGDLGLGYTGGLSAFSVEPFMQQYELFSTASIDFKLLGALRSFVELSYRYNQTAEYLHTYSIDSGIIYTPTKNLQFDTGFYFYLPSNSPYIFIGGTIRI